MCHLPAVAAALGPTAAEQCRRVKRLVLGRRHGVLIVRVAAPTQEEGVFRQSRQVSEMAKLLPFPVWFVVV